MTGVALGDRLLQVGCTDGSLLGAIGSKVGLSGRVCAVVPDDAQAAARAPRRRKIRVPAGNRNGPARAGPVRRRRVQSDCRRQSTGAAVEHAARGSRRDVARSFSPPRPPRPHRRHRAGTARRSGRAVRRAGFRTGRSPLQRLPAAPSSHSRPRASALPAYWESVTGCPSSKASDSGDTRRATLNFPSNSRSMYGKGFAFSQAGILLNGTNTEELPNGRVLRRRDSPGCRRSGRPGGSARGRRAGAFV